MTELPFSRFLESHRERNNATLKSLLETNGPSERLCQAMAYACLNGGKRIRPILVYASAAAVGANLKSADAPAAAVELIHSYSLVHDDLPAMDDDDLRRGQPTTHKAFDEATAILVGDALQSLAFETLSQANAELPASVQLEMVQNLANASGANGMVGGQSVDFEASGKRLTHDELEYMHRLKTGALIRSSVMLGGLCAAEISSAQLDALSLYADRIGLAFQVQDDVLDVTADTQTLGKPQGSDQAQNKPTYVSILGLEQAENLALMLRDEANLALERFDYEANPLRKLADFIVNRQS